MASQQLSGFLTPPSPAIEKPPNADDHHRDKGKLITVGRRHRWGPIIVACGALRVVVERKPSQTTRQRRDGPVR
ncbi:hypothetical protein Q1695_008392 [Nippostrongylus brasiliensis]|nr:hypothetical protein Q1695_008392 [Nippostrongylus brasiliensis]